MSRSICNLASRTRFAVRASIRANIVLLVLLFAIPFSLASSTVDDGLWFPMTAEVDPDGDTLIWDSAVPVGSGAIADIHHNVLLINHPDDILADGVDSINVASVNLHPTGVLTLRGMHIEVLGVSSWTGGTLADEISIGTIGQRGTLTLTGSDLKLLHDVDIENTNRINISGTGNVEIVFATIDNVSHISPDPSVAIIDFQDDTDIIHNSGTGALFNRGVIRKSGGTGVSVIEAPLDNFGDIPNNMAGTFDVQTGTLVLAGGGDFASGTFLVAPDAALDLTGETIHDYTGTFTGSGGGEVRLASGTITADQQNVTFDFDGDTFQWSGGRLNTAGPGSSFTNVDTINVVDGPNDDATLRVNLINQGTVNQTRSTFPLRFVGSGIVENHSLWDLQGDGGFEHTADGGSGTREFNNHTGGVLRKSAGSGTSTLDLVYNNLGGEIDVRTGTLVLARGGDSTGGHFTVDAAATLDLTGGSAHRYTGTYTAEGDGVVALSSGTITADQQNVTFDFDGDTFQWSGGRLNTAGPGSSFTNVDTINVVDGPNGLDVRVNLVNQGTVNHVRSNLPVNALSSGVIDNQSLWDIQGDGGFLYSGGDFNNQATGTLRKSSGSGTSNINVNFNNLGTVEVLSGTLQFTRPVTQTTGTTLTGGTWVVDDGTLILDGGNLATNQGSVALKGENAVFAQINSLADNQGTFQLLEGRDFNTVGDLDNSGLIRLSADSVLTVNDTFTQPASGRLEGNGTLIADAIVNAGTLAPGESAAGSLHVEGPYVQQSTGRLEIEIGGTTVGSQHDQLVSIDTVALDGALRVFGINAGSGPFVPTTGQMFTIITATGGVSGTFDTLTPFAIASGSLIDYSIIYGANDVKLQVDSVTPLLPGDYNGNGVVDASDYAVWRDTVGSINLAADGDQDGTIDNDDYLVWVRNFGRTSGAGSKSAVPEPASLALVGLMVVVICFARRPQCLR